MTGTQIIVQEFFTGIGRLGALVFVAGIYISTESIFNYSKSFFSRHDTIEEESLILEEIEQDSLSKKVSDLLENLSRK